MKPSTGGSPGSRALGAQPASARRHDSCAGANALVCSALRPASDWISAREGTSALGATLPVLCGRVPDSKQPVVCNETRIAPTTSAPTRLVRTERPRMDLPCITRLLGDVRPTGRLVAIRAPLFEAQDRHRLCQKCERRVERR